MALKTQNSDLYFIDPDTGESVSAGCITTFTGLSAPVDEIETTCLNSDERTYVAGMATPGTATFTIQFDPAEASHIRLLELYRQRVVLNWAMGLSDFTGGEPRPEPTGSDSAGEFVLPTNRSFILFSGYISDFPFDFAINTVVTSNLGIRVSGVPDLVVKTT